MWNKSITAMFCDKDFSLSVERRPREFASPKNERNRSRYPIRRYGCDLLKRPAREPIRPEDKTVPESLGLASGVVFVLALVITEASTDNALLSDHDYSAAMLAVALAILLGFADDVLDLEWKYKRPAAWSCTATASPR